MMCLIVSIKPLLFTEAMLPLCIITLLSETNLTFYSSNRPFSKVSACCQISKRLSTVTCKFFYVPVGAETFTQLINMMISRKLISSYFKDRLKLFICLLRVGWWVMLGRPVLRLQLVFVSVNINAKHYLVLDSQ